MGIRRTITRAVHTQDKLRQVHISLLNTLHQINTVRLQAITIHKASNNSTTNMVAVTLNSDSKALASQTRTNSAISLLRVLTISKAPRNINTTSNRAIKAASGRDRRIKTSTVNLMEAIKAARADSQAISIRPLRR